MNIIIISYFANSNKKII